MYCCAEHLKYIIIFSLLNITMSGFPGGSVGKESACSAGELSLIPGLGRSPGEENSNPLQYSCLENSMVGEAWWLQSISLYKVGGNNLILQMRKTRLKFSGHSNSTTSH